MKNTIEKIKKIGAERVIKQMSFSELVDLVNFLVNNQGVTNTTLPISLDTFNFLHTLIDENFRIINANGRGRRARYAGWEYDKQVAYIITQHPSSPTTKQLILNKLYQQEVQRMRNEGIVIDDDFKPINIKTISPLEYEGKYNFDE